MPRIIPNLRLSTTFGLIPIVGLISVVGCAGQQHMTIPSAKPSVASIGKAPSDKDRASHSFVPSAEPSNQTGVVRQVGHSVETSSHSMWPDAPSSALQSSTANSIELNLPTALAMVGGQHPAVGFAR